MIRRKAGIAMAKKMTNEDFLERVHNLVGDEYTFLEDYVNTATRIRVSHNNDMCNNHVYEVMPAKFVKGSRCPVCSVINRTGTDDNFKKRVHNLVGCEYEFLESYKTSAIKIRVRHNSDYCNRHEYEVSPNSFLKGSRCPVCAIEKVRAPRKTQQEWEDEVTTLVGNEYTFLEPYTKSNIEIRVRHNSTNCDMHEYATFPTRFLSGNRCPKCFGSQLKTNDDFLLGVKETIGDEYTFLDEYINSSTKLSVRHNSSVCDNHIYKVAPSSFLSGNRCPVCSVINFSENQTKSHTAFIEEVSHMVGDKYSVMSEYISSSKKVKLKHNECGYEYDVVPNGFLRGNRCPKCQNRIHKDFEYFSSEVFDLVGLEYSISGEYVNTDVKISFSHNKCGHDFEMTPANFLRGQRCPKCSKRMKLNTEIYKQRVYELLGSEYAVDSEYITSTDKVDMIHNKCGNKWSVTPVNFYHNGSRCPKCFGSRVINSEVFQEDMDRVGRKEYILMGEYKGLFSRVPIKHDICGTTWIVRPSGFLYDETRCPKCSKKTSRGEKAIGEFLESAGVDFKFQKIFKECKNVAPLPFDFAVYKDGELAMLIEYDGIQHFKPVDFFGGDLGFERRMVNDGIKNGFCANKNIELLRIPYWEHENIDYILCDSLIKVGILIEVEGVV